MSKRRTENTEVNRKPTTPSDDFGDDGLDDDTLVEAVCRNLEFNPIDSYDDPLAAITSVNNAKANSNKGKGTTKSRSLTKQSDPVVETTNQSAVQLPNGKWACNHSCKDREACKHLCCKDGMDKPPKKKQVTKSVQLSEARPQRQQKLPPPKNKDIQTTLQLAAPKRKALAEIEELDLTQQEKRPKVDQVTDGPKEHTKLQNATKNQAPPSGFESLLHEKPLDYHYQRRSHISAPTDLFVSEQPLDSSDYGSVQFHEAHDSFQRCDSQLGCYSGFLNHETITADASPRSDTFDDDDSLFGDAIIGLADSHSLQANNESETNIMQNIREGLECANKRSLHESQWTNQKTELLRNDRDVVLTSALDDNEMEGITDPKAGVILTASNQGQQGPMLAEGSLNLADVYENSVSTASSEQKLASVAFKDLDPWLYQEFGNIVELVDE